MTKKKTAYTPEEYKPKKMPEFSYDMQTSTLKKEYRFLVQGAMSELGEKVFKNEVPFSDIIGDRPSVCRDLYHVGQVVEGIVVNGNKLFNFGLTEFSNHCWMPQINRSDPAKRMLQVCVNCGSIMMYDPKTNKNEFYSYLDVEAHEKEKGQVKN